VSRVLIIDDDRPLRLAVARALTREGHTVLEAGDGDEGLALVVGEAPDLVLLDLDMPRVHGLEVLRRVRADDGPPVVVMTSLTDAKVAQEADRLGAERFIVKPLDMADLVRVVQRIGQDAQRESELQALRARQAHDEIVGTSQAMRVLGETLSSLEDVDVSAILLTGESGTGKDLVARAIHARGRRRTEPLIEVDCAALPETLIESILFGHERGAFTDARTQKRGLFEVAGHGTVFLDEVGEIPLTMQARLLRALESRRVKRVGGTVDVPIHATVIAATNRRLDQLVAEGLFRSDLYYRLNVFPIALPALRERSEDIAPLAEHFVRVLAPRVGRPEVPLSPEALAALARYRWPGNVRELRNVIERALILTRGPRIELSALPAEVQGPGTPLPSSGGFQLPAEGLDLEALERDLLRQALERTGGNRTRAGRLLGISRHALAYRLKQLEAEGIVPDAGADADD
jgi:two-component system, NtrC family, response regulator AtoC